MGNKISGRSCKHTAKNREQKISYKNCGKRRGDIDCARLHARFKTQDGQGFQRSALNCSGPRFFSHDHKTLLFKFCFTKSYT